MADEPIKRCTKCKEELPATPEFFWRRVYNADGLWDICKACCSEMPCMVNRTAKRHAAKLQRLTAKAPPGVGVAPHQTFSRETPSDKDQPA